MEHFLLQLTKTSAIGGAVIALLLTLRPFLGKRYRARMYYWLWLVLAVALLPSPVYTGANAPVQITPPSEHVMVWTDKAAIVPKISHKDNFVTVSDGVTPALSHIQPGDDFTQSLPSTPIRRIVDVSSVLFWAWLAGVAMFLTVQAIGYGRFRRLAHRWSEPLKNDRYGEFLREEASALGLTAPKAALCPAVSTPALTGLIRPKLLLPHEDYTETELRFVLRHELTHLKHRDIPYKLLLTFANALHWFNPLVYLMLRAADEDIELSCDSAVTRNMEKEERAAYSETLLKAVRSKGDTVVLTSCFGSTVERLKRRITNILDGRKKSRGVAVIVLAICTVAALGAAVGFVPSKSAPKTHGAYADVEDYLMHKMPSIGSEVSYYPYSEDGTILEETTAKVLDRKLAWLNQTGTVANLAPEGVLQSWTYSYLLQLDAPTDDVLLVGGMYEENGYFDLEGQNGHDLIVLQYDDGSIDVLYDAPVNDNLGVLGCRLDYEEAIYDWYVKEYDLDQTEYPLYVIDWSDYFRDLDDAYPAHRYDGDGWYLYVPIHAWEPGVGEPIWYSSYGTDSTIVVKTFDTPLSDAQAYFENNGWTRGQGDVYLRDQDGQHAAVYLFENPDHLHYEVQTFWYDQSDGVNEWGWSAKVQVETEQKILALMAKSFTVTGGSRLKQSCSVPVVQGTDFEVLLTVNYCTEEGADGPYIAEITDAKAKNIRGWYYVEWEAKVETEQIQFAADRKSAIVPVIYYASLGSGNHEYLTSVTIDLSDETLPAVTNETPQEQTVSPSAPRTAESIKASADSSLEYGGYLWFIADGYFSRYADTGSIEQLYELPLGYDDETPVFASISVIAAKVALSYHVGGAIMGYDELRLFDTQTGAQTHEISGYGSFAINGDTIVKTTGFMPPAAGNLRISRDCGKTWENLGDPKYLYGMSVTADGNTVSYRGEQGILSLHDDYLYIAGVDTSSWDGSSTQLPETLSLRVDLNTGETKVRID